MTIFLYYSTWDVIENDDDDDDDGQMQNSYSLNSGSFLGLI